MYIDFTCIAASPLSVPQLREVHNRLQPVVGDSLVLINLAMMHYQQVMFVTPQQLAHQIDVLVETLPPDMLFMYVGGQGDLLPQAKIKLREDMWAFINGTINFIDGQQTIRALIAAAFERNYYVRANHVMDDALQPYLIVTVTPRV